MASHATIPRPDRKCYITRAMTPVLPSDETIITSYDYSFSYILSIWQAKAAVLTLDIQEEWLACTASSLVTHTAGEVTPGVATDSWGVKTSAILLPSIRKCGMSTSNERPVHGDWLDWVEVSMAGQGHCLWFYGGRRMGRAKTQQRSIYNYDLYVFKPLWILYGYQ